MENTALLQMGRLLIDCTIDVLDATRLGLAISSG